MNNIFLFMCTLMLQLATSFQVQPNLLFNVLNQIFTLTSLCHVNRLTAVEVENKNSIGTGWMPLSDFSFRFDRILTLCTQWPQILTLCTQSLQSLTLCTNQPQNLTLCTNDLATRPGVHDNFKIWPPTQNNFEVWPCVHNYFKIWLCSQNDIIIWPCNVHTINSTIWPCAQNDLITWPCAHNNFKIWPCAQNDLDTCLVPTKLQQFDIAQTNHGKPKLTLDWPWPNQSFIKRPQNKSILPLQPTNFKNDP